MTNYLFGTDGIRTRIGHEPLTIEGLQLLGTSIALWLQTKERIPAYVMIGSDSRNSSDWIKSSLCSRLLHHNITVYDAGIVTTPALSAIIQQQKNIACGIMITASHNLYYDNGIKIIDSTGQKICSADSALLSTFFYSTKKNLPAYDQFGTIIRYESAIASYIDIALQWFPSSFLSGYVIVLDCANGATSYIAPELFSRLGAHVIPIHASPDGFNINNQSGSLHPSHIASAVLNHNADVGFAFDGDGDRIIAVNRDGFVKNGDDILALIAELDEFRPEDTIVGTIMTNQGLAAHLAYKGKTLVRTAVGDTHIATHLANNNLTLGGEPSGHIIMRNYLSSSDGVFTALKLMQALIQSNNWQMESFDHYPQSCINIPVTSRVDLSTSSLQKIVAYYEKHLLQGRVVIRYSGTEPLLRVMVEEKEQNKAVDICHNLAHELHQELLRNYG